MGEDNMNPEKGGNTFGMAAEGARVRTKPSPPRALPPIEPAPKSPQPPKKRGLGKKTKIALAGFGLAVASPLGVAAGQHHFKADEPISPAGITRDIQAIPGQIADWFRSGKVDVPPFFDNSKNSGAISPNNSVIIRGLSLIQNVEVVPSGANPKHDVNLLFPIQGLPPTGINYSKDFQGKNDSNPIFPEEIRQYAKANGIENVMVFQGIPKDSIIISPVDGVIRYNDGGNHVPPGQVHSAIMSYSAPDGTVQNILIAITLTSRSNNSGFLPLIQSKLFKVGDAGKDIREFQVPVKRGQPIFRTTKDASEVRITTMALPTPTSSGNELYPTNINLITTPNPSTGEQKVVIVAQ